MIPCIADFIFWSVSSIGCFKLVRSTQLYKLEYHIKHKITNLEFNGTKVETATVVYSS